MYNEYELDSSFADYGGISGGNAMNMPEFKAFVDEKLKRMDRSEAWLGRQLGYSSGQFGKWLNGKNRMPYEAVLGICEFLELTPLQHVQLMDLAGYPPPRWARPRFMQDAPGSLSRPDTAFASELVEEFTSAAEYFDYARTAITEARFTVDDLSWGIDLPSFSQREDDSYYAYLDVIPKACRRGVIYREVMTFRNSRHYLERANALLQQDLIAYNLRFYDIDLRMHPPLMAVMIVDNTVALLAWYRWPYLPPHAEKRIAIRQPATVALLADYFETVWFGARSIKNGDRVDWDEVEEIRNLWK